MQLMQGDCLEWMKNIPDGSVDMVLCDLPYGTTRNRWDSVIPFAPLWAQWHRVRKLGAAVVLFSQQPFTAALIQSNPREFRYEFVWIKNRSTGFLNAHKMPLKAHENICVFYDHLPTYNPQMAKGCPYRATRGKAGSNYGALRSTPTICTGERYPTDILNYATVPSTGEGKESHPTQKPVALLEYLIKTYTSPGETVLDNCMGSGSTGVACVNTGRDFIGIELDPGYFETARRRIEDAGAQMHF